jgi:hypothetical protein
MRLINVHDATCNTCTSCTSNVKPHGKVVFFYTFFSRGASRCTPFDVQILNIAPIKPIA